MGMPGIYELVILAGICAVPLIAIVVVIAVVANVKRK